LLHRHSLSHLPGVPRGDPEEGVMSDHDHQRYMRRAIELAANVPNLPFVAVIVNRDSDKIVAEGWNKSSTNSTWHGEIDAINQLVPWNRR
jgi:tRNA(Arg) A34 adenosine deaminase TadA